MNHSKGKEFSWVEGLAICLSMIGVQLCSEVINQWGLYFYSPSAGVGRTIYVSVGMVGIIFIVGTIWDAFSSPVIGMLSDGTSTRPGRWRLIPIPGRRLPYIFWGALLMIATMIGFWYPPVNGTSVVNLLYGTFFLCAHWTLFSVAVVPLTALGPEIARSEQARVAVGTWTAIGMILGLALANALPGVLIAAMDPGRVERSLTLNLPAHSVAPADAVNALLAQDPALAGKAKAAGNGVSVEGVPSAEIVVAGGAAGAATVAMTGAFYDDFRGKAEQSAITALAPAAIRDKYKPIVRKAWHGLDFGAAGLDGAVLDTLRGQAVLQLQPVLAAEAKEIREGDRTVLVFPTLMAERVDATALGALMAAGAPGIQGKVAVVLAPGELRFVLPEGAAATTEVCSFLADAAAKHLVAGNLIRLGRTTAVFTKALRSELGFAGIQQALAAAAPGATVSRVEESFSPAGYRRVSTIFAFLSFALFLLPVIFIRERYDSEAVASEPLPWGSGVFDALRNKPFVIYALSFFFFTIGFLAVQRVLPYWAELGLDGDESTITMLLVPFILVAIVSFAVIPIVSRYLHMKWMIFIALAIIATGMPCMYLIGKSTASFETRQLLGMMLFGYCGVGQAIIYIMMVPMMGDIIDYDERLSGERREALYNGLSAFIWKASMAGSVLLASQSMNLWGNRIEEYTGVLLVGPFAGLFGLIGMCLISFYPVTKQEKKEG